MAWILFKDVTQKDKKMGDDLKRKLTTGLTSSPKFIPHLYVYDDAGSIIQYKFVTECPDYYLTRSERSILEHRIQEIIPCFPYDMALVDMGSGNCSKTRLVIDELLQRQNKLTFYPVDISEEFLMKAANALSEEYGDSLEVKPIAAEYGQGIEQLRRVKGAKIIMWLSSIINLPYDEQVNTLRRISTIMTDKCRLIFSADVTQDRSAIMKAYNDDAGMLQALNTNAIERLNKEEGSEIDIARFTYGVDFISDNNPQYMSYTRVFMKANESIQYPIPGLGIDLQMDKEERLYLHEGEGYSCKYTLEQLHNIVKKAGLRLVSTCMDENQHGVLYQCATV
ncbi:uncharacterized protein LOC110453346 [Mizuhopecten yessoensis]|uniref:Histidine-specific methyltransferase EgtD n=1 Tax=Mizuhopecten yessoensis TaxID=6573 RepID=A0A210QHM4_MIZYE|nr:uncharacterized protein LOC110453346 [Mizuhopecten yessoensis]OWF48186.1 Histidine-specific methyltransferase EgtD [Mizuhopecten yessoensis]